jgi:hypothetical protein
MAPAFSGARDGTPASPTLVYFSRNSEAERAQALATLAPRWRVCVVRPSCERDDARAHLELERPYPNLTLVTPVLPMGLRAAEAALMERYLLGDLFRACEGSPLVTWFESPRPLRHAAHLADDLCVYEVTQDEADAWEGDRLERDLLTRADLVFAPPDLRDRIAHARTLPVGDFARAWDVVRSFLASGRAFPARASTRRLDE